MRHPLIAIALFTLLLAHQRVAAQDTAPLAAPDRPNVVIFFVDDMGWQDTSLPFHIEATDLNRRYHTPHMTRLASQGVVFTRGYASAVCSPSRVSLLTGMAPARHGVTNWTLRRDRSPDPNHPRIQPPDWPLNGLAAEPGTPHTVVATPLTEALRGLGYRTIHAGKAHWGAQSTPGSDPLNLGFDVNIAGHYAGGPGSYYGLNNFSAEWRGGGTIWDVPGLAQYHGTDINLTEAITLETLAALDQCVADEQPFFLYLSHYAIHAPWEPDTRFLPHYQQQGLTGMPAAYASMIESMDHSLGDVLDWLDQQSLADDTLVVFMSDNGAPAQAPQNHPLRGSKLTPYEGGFRVPTIVRWPGHAPVGERLDTPVAVQDLLVTALDAAGTDAHTLDLPQTIDGRSILPLLHDAPDARAQARAAARDRELLFHFPHTYNSPPYSALIRGEWKLIWWHAGQRAELFNLADDLSEANNLADAEPAQLNRMIEALNRSLAEQGALLPIDKQTGEPFPLPTPVETAEPLSRTAEEVAGEADRRGAFPTATPDTLNLAPRLQPLTDACLFRDPDWHHWGASIVQDDAGTWHMFYARWPLTTHAERGFSDWLWTSEIAHAVADDVAGPYTHTRTVLHATNPGHWDSLTAHNPRIRHIDGRFYLYYISHGQFNELPPPDQRTRRHANWSVARNSQYSGVAVADHIAGPYTRCDAPIAVGDGPLAHLAVNPTLIARPDGQYQLIVKGDAPGGGLRIYGQLLADSPTGPFTWQDEVIATGFNTEDPDAWYDVQRNRYYALVTHAGNANGDALALITSDDGLNWRLAAHPSVLGHAFPLADGTTLRGNRIERPSVVRDNSGQVVALTTTLHSSPNRDWQTSTTVILPLD